MLILLSVYILRNLIIIIINAQNYVSIVLDIIFIIMYNHVRVIQIYNMQILNSYEINVDDECTSVSVT